MGVKYQRAMYLPPSKNNASRYVFQYPGDRVRIVRLQGKHSIAANVVFAGPVYDGVTVNSKIALTNFRLSGGTPKNGNC